MRSPSFSRSSESITTRNSPALNAAKALSIGSNAKEVGGAWCLRTAGTERGTEGETAVGAIMEVEVDLSASMSFYKM